MAHPKKSPLTVTLDAKAIGEQIRSARVKRDWTVTELARVVGVTKGTVSSWELGYRAPPLAALVRVAIALRRSPNCFLCVTGLGQGSGVHRWPYRKLPLPPGPP